MATPSPSQIEDVVNSGIQNLFDQMNFGGIAAAFYYPASSEVAPYYHHGQANESSAMSEETIVCVGSITKTFTASLLAYLYQTGKVGSLDYAVVKAWLPAVDSDTMTLFELATQTSGMPEAGGGVASENLFTDQPPSDELVSWWSNPNNYNQTEGEWVYSNVGFVTLGFADVAIQNKGAFTPGYTDLLSDVITSKTDPPMSSTFLTIPSSVPASRIAQGHLPDSPKPLNIQDAWDIKSTATDMYAWMKTNLEALSTSKPNTLQKALAMAASVQLANPIKSGGQPCNFDMGFAWQIFNKQPGLPTIIAKDGATSKAGCCGWIGMVQKNVRTGAPPMGLALLLNCDDMHPGKTGALILQKIAALF